jgi:N-acylneuraminate cytidylyltransferase
MRYAIIPARGGSNRIPRKNIRLFHGRPIIVYSIETALQSKLFDVVFVSTDDREITEIAESVGAMTIRRPAELADDATGTQAVAKHALQHLNARERDLACCIYPTAPLLAIEDLARGYRLLCEKKAAFAFSIGTEPLHDAGQFYWGEARSFLNGVPLFGPDSIMVPIDKSRVCDINTEDDWQRAERMFAALPPPIYQPLTFSRHRV